jgi:hypothetical protein
VATSEPGQFGGYKTSVIMGGAIIWYRGHQPLVKTPGTVSVSELLNL